MCEIIKLHGTFYEVGKQLGSKFSEEMHYVVNTNKNSDFWRKTEDYIRTQEGEAVLEQLRQTTLERCPDYVTELRGMADGSEVDFEDLFILNLGPEFVALLEETPEGSHDVLYSSVFAGCTNISIETENGQVYVAHTEDIPQTYLGSSHIVHATIVDNRNNIVEDWYHHVTIGILAGSKFGFNSHGICAAQNAVIQKGINKKGIPRLFMARSLLGVPTIGETEDILRAEPGQATGYTYLLFQRTPSGDVTQRMIEVAGHPEGHSLVKVFEPRGFYHHCNIYQHLSYPCHPEESSIHRAAVISQYRNRSQGKNTVADLLRIISDRNDIKFPVYRNGERPDYLATAATGVFDMETGKIKVYTSIPDENKPTFVFPIPDGVVSNRGGCKD